MVKLLGNNLILIGFMGSGKTTVGKRLAQMLGYQFLDTDSAIEQREKASIPSIFEHNGEVYFRELETKLLTEQMSSLSHTVLSTGGGLPVRQENREMLQKLGYVIYLESSAETTMKRLKNDRTRPLLMGADREAKLNQMLKERAPIYESAAHQKICTDDMSVEEITAQIILEYHKQSGQE